VDPVIVSSLITIGGTVILAPIVSMFANRKQVKTDQFRAITDAQNTRIGDLEKQVATLGAALRAKEKAVEDERVAHAATREQLAAVTEQLATMKDTVRRYFEKITAAWPEGRGLMPRPDPDDLDWLSKPVPAPATPAAPDPTHYS
jgi:uncharacterized coiled-coil protein SlyX